MRLFILQSIFAMALVGLSPAGHASHAFYVGKNLTADHGVLIGGTGEEVSSHWLNIIAAADHAANATVRVGVTADANIPGKLIAIPQARHTYRYLSMAYSDYEGFPAPLTNGGVNEHQVAVRDVWATNRQALIDMTPKPQTGPQYSDLARLVLQRAKTAREGVALIGRLIGRYGYSTYGGNTHLIADPNEAWVVWEFAGGQKLWAAERLGANDVRVLYPGYIQDFPVDYQHDPNYMGSPNLVAFAAQHGWFDPDAGTPFNIFKAYGPRDTQARTGGYKYMTQAELEQATRDMAPVSQADMIKRLRDDRISDDEAGNGQVISLKAGVDPDLIRIWVAPIGAVASPFVPWWLGVQRVPMAYGEHRYLTKDAGSSFLNPDFQAQEATDFAGRRFKQVLYYMCAKPDIYQPVVTRMLQGFEQQSRDNLPWVENSARTLIRAHQRGAAQRLLTFYSTTRAVDAMSLGATLVDGLDAYSRLVTGLARPQGAQINSPGGETVNCLVGADPDKPKRQQ